MKIKKMHPLAALYLAAGLIWLAAGGFCLARELLLAGSGKLVTAQLTMEDFNTEAIILHAETGSWVTTDPNSEMVYRPEQPFYFSSFEYRQTTAKDNLGVELYYTTAPGEVFTERKKLLPQKSDPVSGNYLFTLPATKVYALRVDPDRAGGVLFTPRQMTLNGDKSLAAFWCLDFYSLALFMTLPAAVYGFYRCTVRRERD